MTKLSRFFLRLNFAKCRVFPATKAYLLTYLLTFSSPIRLSLSHDREIFIFDCRKKVNILQEIVMHKQLCTSHFD